MKKRVLSIILMISLFVLTLTTSVNALSFTATMKANNTTVPESTEFAVTVKVSNLDVGTNGINSLSGYLKYDTEVFETISESGIEGLNGWNAKFDETTGKIELTKSTFVTSAQEVFQITFKTKSDVSGKSGSISFSNIVASNSESDITATDISTQISIGETGDPVSPENVTNTPSNTVVISPNTITNTPKNNSVTNNSANQARNNTNNNTATNVNNNTVSGYVNTNNMTNTSADEDMPYTGVNDTILKLIFVIIAVAIVFYVKIEKINKDIE